MTDSRKSFATRLALEGVVIVASILLAFALDTWWDRAQQRQEERQILTALQQEFREARNSVVRYRGFQERVLSQVIVLTDSLRVAMADGRSSVSVADTTLGITYIPPVLGLIEKSLEG